MANILKISTIGPATINESPPINQSAVTRMIEHWKDRLSQVLPDQPDLIVVPECCDYYLGHTPAQQIEYCRVRGDQLLELFSTTAVENHCHMVYPSLQEASDGTWRNRAQMVGPDGSIIGAYDKNHPVVSHEIEEQGVLAGVNAPLIDCDFGKVAFAICFDLNFDQLRLQYRQKKPDLILFPSMYHGSFQQLYWAFSCRSHFVGAVAGMPCEIISPLGTVLAKNSPYYFDYVTATINLDCFIAHLNGNREKLIDLKKKYGLQVRIDHAGLLGPVLVSSESKSISSLEMAKSFEIELYDDFLNRCLLAHENTRCQ